MSGVRVLVAAAILAIPFAPIGAASSCTSQDVWISGCSDGVVDGDHVDLRTEEERSASNSGDGGGGAGSGSGHGAGSGGAGYVADDPVRFENPGCDSVTTGGGVLQCNAPWSTTPVEGDDEATATVTLSDIASFRPTPGRQAMQPNGWAIVGLDTNFYAITSPHIVDGTLLGRPASVRFTPVAYHWDYGDGTRVTLPTKGGTWEQLHLDEFDPTPTSHVYQEKREYTITLTISFAPEYRYAGSSWIPIAGTIPLPANDLHITVTGVKTVLVDENCNENPSGPGC